MTKEEDVSNRVEESEVVVAPVAAAVVVAEQTEPVKEVLSAPFESPVVAPVQQLVESPVRPQEKTPVLEVDPKTPVRDANYSITTPKTVKESDDLADDDDDDDINDVTVAPDLLPKSSPATLRNVIPDFVRPAVTSSSPVLPDSSWLTPPSERRNKTPNSAATTSPLRPASPARFDPSGAVNIFSPERATVISSPVATSPVMATVSDVAPSITPAKSSILDISIGSAPVAFSPSQATLSFSPSAPTLPVDLFSPEKFAPSSPVVVEEMKVHTPAQEAAPAEDPVLISPAKDAPHEVVEFAGWGDGLLSPIREETDEYAASSNLAPASSVAAAPVAAAPVAAPSVIASPVQTAPVADVVVPVTPVAAAKTTNVVVVESPVVKVDPITPLATPGSVIAAPKFAPLTPIATPSVSSTSASVDTGVAAVSVFSPLSASIPAPVPAAVGGAQSELESIKQKIRLWDVTSPSKPAAVSRLAETPEKVPKFTQQDLLKAKSDAEKAAQEENAKLRAEFLELQKVYEQEKKVSAQFKEVVDEFESTLRAMVESHNKVLLDEKARASELMQQNAELLSFVEETQKKADLASQEKAAAMAELEAAKKARMEAEEDLAASKASLDAALNKYQALKQQADKKLALANERIQQQVQATTEQVATMKSRLAAAVTKVEDLNAELAAKKQENAELVNICSQLVSQVEQLTKK